MNNVLKNFDKEIINDLVALQKRSKLEDTQTIQRAVRTIMYLSLKVTEIGSILESERAL